MRLQMRACDAPLCVPCYAQLMPPCRPRVKQLRLPGTVLAATHGGDVTIAADSMLIQAALQLMPAGTGGTGPVRLASLPAAQAAPWAARPRSKLR